MKAVPLDALVRESLQALVDLGVTRAVLARRLHVTVPTLTRWLAGDTRKLHAGHLDACVSYLHELATTAGQWHRQVTQRIDTMEQEIEDGIGRIVEARRRQQARAEKGGVQ